MLLERKTLSYIFALFLSKISPEAGMTQRQFLSSGLLFGVVITVCAGLGVARFSLQSSDNGKNRTAGSPEKAAHDAASEQLTLPVEEREYIWQIEHCGLMLSKFGFKPLAECWSRGDANGIATRMASDFYGQLLQKPREVKASTEYAQVVRQQDSGQPPLDVGNSRFIERLLALRRNFAADKQPKFGFNLITLSPVDRAKPDGLWHGTGLLRMWGEAAPGQPAEVVLNIQYHIDRPSEERLAQPGWLHACAIMQSQEGRASRFLLRDATKERGIDPKEYHDNWVEKTTKTATGGVFLCDYNRDGIMDMLVTDLNRNTLYKGKPDGTFEDVTLAAGLPMMSTSTTSLKFVAAFVDIDGDGWEDLILANQVFRNENGKFVNYTHRTNFRPAQDAVGYAVADYDRDGRPDIYVMRPGKSYCESWLDGHSGDPLGNELWHNLGNWQFEQIAAKAGAEGGHRSTFSAVWLDANNDGWPDLYVINEFGNGVLLINQADGTFREHQLAAGPSDFGSMGVAAGDIDNDGNIDIYTANMYSKAGARVIGNVKPGSYPEPIMAKIRSFVAGSQLWRNRGGLQFEPIGKKCQLNAVGWGYGADLFDLDNDGWLDLYATAGFISQDRSQPDG
jgi:hypothetical protein